MLTTVDADIRLFIPSGDIEGDPALISSDVRTLFRRWTRLAVAEHWVLAHLGQSVDGRIATQSGHSHYIGGPESLVHLHRLRALADAVVVGGATVALDQPRLTTRHVEGADPRRVVIDRRGRLSVETPLFDDGLGPVTVFGESGRDDLPDQVEAIALGPDFGPQEVIDALRVRGFNRVLVEGGGQTVSGFLEAGTLDFLQLAVAPLIIGSGRSSIELPVIERLDDARRPPTRTELLGNDVLFDFDLAEP
ncbi:MAG: RibD family protein [Geminicoccaceae bacterium]